MSGSPPEGLPSVNGDGAGETWPRSIIHVDMDAFFASVEVLDRPELAGRPVVVGGTPQGRGVVSAASYEARRFGIHSAMSAARARALCPRAVFLEPRLERYGEVSRAVFAVFGDYTPLVEPLSIDEAFLDVTGCRRLHGSATDIGHAIKDRIRSEIGLTASVGISYNKFLAKLASDLEKPDGFVVVSPLRAPELLRRLPIERMWGVGKAAAAQLHLHGVRTIGDLLVVPEPVLAAKFGVQAGRWQALGRGMDDRPVVPAREAKSIGNEMTFPEDITAAEQLRGVCDLLADKVGHRLRVQGLQAGTITLKVRFADFTTCTRSLRLQRPTDSSVKIRETARELLETRVGRRGRALRLLGVTASHLDLPVAEQADLFGDGAADERQRRLDRIMDRVQARYGSKLHRGATRNPGRDAGKPD